MKKSNKIPPAVYKTAGVFLCQYIYITIIRSKATETCSLFLITYYLLYFRRGFFCGKAFFVKLNILCKAVNILL